MPPARGRRRPSSPKQNAPTSATAPPSNQTPSASAPEPARAATCAGVTKMPDPMMPPTTAIVAEKGPSARRYETAAPAAAPGPPVIGPGSP